MKRLTTLALINAISIGPALAQTSDALIAAAYLRNDRDYRIRCEFEDKTNFIQSLRPTTKPFFKSSSLLHQRFELETKNSKIPFDVKVFESKGRAAFELNFDGKVQRGFVEEGKNIYLKKQMSFTGPVASAVTCYAEFVTENLYPLGDGKVHINVHPHKSFDMYGNTVKSTNQVYADASYKHILLLEDDNYKESKVNLVNFLRTGQLNVAKSVFSPVPVTAAADTTMLVAPSGVNRYNLTASTSVDILYTGGNHNYCMFQNIQQLMNALMRSNKSPKININFKQEAMVLQRNGAASGIGFGRFSRIRSGNQFTYVMQDQELAVDYHTAYFAYFAQTHFKNFGHRFSELVINYKAPQYKKSVRLRGTGERVLTVNFNYL